MRKREQGVLTVEASIILLVFTLFSLFLFNFARLYRTQSLVSHATIEAADAIALESYIRETAFASDPQEIVYLVSKIDGSASINADNLESLRSADIPRLAKQRFAAAIASTEADADKKLEAWGVEDGLDGVDFSGSYVEIENEEVILYLNYVQKLRFPVFGFESIQFTKAAKAKTFGEIKYDISTQANNSSWGSTSGDSKVTHGSYVTITATPNYGYRFVKWNDGNTDNPRTVQVTDVSKYVAIFEEADLGINLYMRKTGTNELYRQGQNVELGSVTGSGSFNYMHQTTIKAEVGEHYTFDGWDDNMDGVVDSRENPRTVILDKTRHITAMYTPKSYTITVTSANTAWGTAMVLDNKETSITAPYKSKVTLLATAKENYEFTNWNNTLTNMCEEVTVLGNKTYTANFKEALRTVTFMVDNKEYATVTVKAGKSIAASGGTMPENPKIIGKVFKNWDGFGPNTVVNENKIVTATWGNCATHDWGRCGVTHKFGYSVGLILDRKTHDTDFGQCIVCANCGVGAYTWDSKSQNTVETWTGQKGRNYGCKDIMFGQYCFEHEGCIDMWNENIIYNIHGDG